MTRSRIDSSTPKWKLLVTQHEPPRSKNAKAESRKLSPPHLYLFLLSVVLLGCPKDPPGVGFLAVQVHVLEAGTGELADLNALRFATTSIEVVHRSAPDAPEQVLVVDAQAHDFAVVLEAGEVAQVTLLAVPPGLVSQVRFISKVAAATTAGEQPVKLPSGENSGLKLNAPGNTPFPIVLDRLTRISGEFATNDRIVRNKGIGLLLKPTVPAVLVQAPGTRPVPPQYAVDFLYVCFKRGTTAARADQVHASLGSTVVRRSQRHVWDTVKLANGKAEAVALAEYRAVPEVELAMLSYNAQTENAEPAEWSGSMLPPQQYLRQTSSIEAWDLTSGTHFPIVAVADNNINIFSFELQENIFVNPDEVPTQVTLNTNCTPLATPLALVTVDTNNDGVITGRDMDVDRDGFITLRDINAEPNRTLHRAALAARMESVPDVISLLELLRPEDTVMAASRPTAVADGKLRCGLWEDLVDGPPGNGLVDDISGWDFVVNRNVPVSDVPRPNGGPRDGTGHGHWVAGVLSAVNNADSLFPSQSLAQGYVGQAWKVRILPVRINTEEAPTGFPEGGVFGSQGVYHDGLSYAVDMKADVINMSFSLICTKRQIDPVPPGYVCPNFTDKTAEYRKSFDVAGLTGTVLLVVGPVNQPIDLDSEEVLDLPAELLLPNQINVGSVTLGDVYRKDLVSFGVKTYHLAAPSQSMPLLAFGGVGPGFQGDPSPDDGVETDGVAGNSLAAPQVVGTAALMLSINEGLRGNPIELKKRLLNSATVLSALRTKVGGNGRRLNVRAAVESAQP